MMTMFRVSLVAALLAALVAVTARAEDGPYKEDWESLSKHEAAPEWFQDTKLGIYFHWGFVVSLIRQRNMSAVM